MKEHRESAPKSIEPKVLLLILFANISVLPSFSMPQTTAENNYIKQKM